MSSISSGSCAEANRSQGIWTRVCLRGSGMAKQRRLNLQSVWPPWAVLSWHWEPLVIQERFRGSFAALS